MFVSEKLQKFRYVDVALPVLVMLLVLNLLLLVLLIFFPKNIKDIFNSSNSLSFGSFS